METLAIGPSGFVVNIADGSTQMNPPASVTPTRHCDPPLPTTGGGHAGLTRAMERGAVEAQARSSMKMKAACTKGTATSNPARNLVLST